MSFTVSSQPISLETFNLGTPQNCFENSSITFWQNSLLLSHPDGCLFTITQDSSQNNNLVTCQKVEGVWFRTFLHDGAYLDITTEKSDSYVRKFSPSGEFCWEFKYPRPCARKVFPLKNGSFYLQMRSCCRHIIHLNAEGQHIGDYAWHPSISNNQEVLNNKSVNTYPMKHITLSPNEKKFAISYFQVCHIKIATLHSEDYKMLHLEKEPSCFCFITDEVLLVAFSDEVQVINMNGEVLGSFGLGFFDKITHIALNGNGRAVVVNNNCRISYHTIPISA